MQNGFKFLMHLKSKTSQFEIDVKVTRKSLVGSYTKFQIEVIESFKLLVATKVKNTWR